jgi:hypothetical protein
MCGRPVPILLAWCALAALIALDRAALAQGKLDVHYRIVLARVSVGEIKANIELSGSEYRSTVDGRARGLLKALISGEGEMSVRGAIEDGSLVPVEYNSKLSAEAGTDTVSIVLDHGAVKEFLVTPAPIPNDGGDTTQTIQGVVDPLTALLLPAPAGQEALSAEACQRTISVFDGRHRYDLKFASKRLDKSPEPNRPYSGPVLVCSLAYQPSEPHHSNPLGKYLSEGREMEIAFVLLPGTRVLAPVRFSVASMIANLAIEVDRFEWMAAPANSAQ